MGIGTGRRGGMGGAGAPRVAGVADDGRGHHLRSSPSSSSSSSRERGAEQLRGPASEHGAEQQRGAACEWNCWRFAFPNAPAACTWSRTSATSLGSFSKILKPNGLHLEQN